MNSQEEAERRIRISERHLKEAKEAWKRNDFPEVVGHSQLSVENAAKAVISCFRIPSWSHDPSQELRGAVREVDMDEWMRKRIESLADSAHILAPEHGRSDYGTLTRLPEELYGKENAEEVLRMAEEGFECAAAFIRKFFG